MGYDAFISYSHAADSQLAPRLQDGLQRMAKPWYRRRALHVFRDNTGLTANPGLWSSIESAMDDSEWFVFLASPEAAASPWVARELGHWLQRHGPDRVLPVLTDGTWAWDPVRNDFDAAMSTAVPTALFGVFAEEPRHVDMTWARTEDQVDLRNGRFRDQVAEVAAPIHGVAKDDLEGADVREHRRTLRWAWGAAAVLLLLTVFSALAGVLAVRNADEAAMQRISAEQNATEAERNAAEADRNATEAEQNATEAERNAAEAEENATEAEQNAGEAERQRAAAEEQRANAESSEERAVDEAARADEAAEAARREEEAARASEAAATESRDAAQRALDGESRARSAEEAARRDAEANAVEAQRQGEAASASERVAQLRANEALEQRSIAEQNAAEATRQQQAAQASEAQAIASRRQAEQALASEQQARTAEELARAQAEASASEARAAQVAAEQAAAAEAAARAAESEARQSAETEALASASSAQASQDGGLSLLLAVEAARRGQSPRDPQAAAAGTQRSALLRQASPGDSVTGRRALFEAVTAAQGGANRHRVDRYLPMPPDVVDPPVNLYRPTLSEDGRYLAAAELADPYRAARGPVPTRVFVWDLRSPTASVTVLSGHTDQVVDIAFAGGGVTLVTQDAPFGGAPVARVWDLRTGTELLAREALMFVSPTGGHIALQSLVAAEVEFVDGSDGTVTAVQPGFLALDPLTTLRNDAAQDPPWIERPFSADGRWAYGNSGGRAVLWDLAAGGGPTVPLAGPAALWSVSPRVAPDGSGLAAAVENGSDLAFFDAATGTPLGSFTVSAGTIRSLTWNADGSRLAILDDVGQLIVLDNDTDGVDGSWSASVAPGEVAFDRTGRYLSILVPGGHGYSTSMYDLVGGASLGVFEGQFVASRSTDAPDWFFLRNDGTVAMVSSMDGRVAAGDERSAAATAVALSGDGRWLAASNGSGTRVWDLAAPGDGTFVAGPAVSSLGLAFVPGSNGLVGTGTSAVATVWDVGRIGAGSSLGATVPDSTVLADGVTVLEPSEGGTATRFRNLLDGATRPGPPLAPGERVDFLLSGPEGHPLVVNLEGGTAIVATGDGTTVGRVSGPVATTSRDGSRIAVRDSARSVSVLDSATLGTVRTISLEALPDDDVANQADSVALDPDGSLLAATNGTGVVVVWDVSSGDVVSTIDGSSSDRISFPLWGLGFSPDGSRLVVKAPSNTVRMYAVDPAGDWDLLATEQLPRELAGRVVFSPDGALIAIDGLFLLDGATLRPIATLLAGPGSVTRFSADGTSLVTIAATGSEGPDDFRQVVRWSVSTDELATEACRMSGRNLSVDEWNRYLGGSGEPYRATCAGRP